MTNIINNVTNVNNVAMGSKLVLSTSVICVSTIGSGSLLLVLLM